MWQDGVADRDGLREVNGENRVDVRGYEDDLVTVAVAGVVGVGGSAGCAVAAAAAVTGVMHGAILRVEGVSAWIVHEVAFAAGAKVTVLACVGVAVVVVVAVAAIVDATGVVMCWLAFNAIVIVVGAVVIAVRCLDVAIRGGVVVLGNLHLLWLCYWGCIAVSNS